MAVLKRLLAWALLLFASGAAAASPTENWAGPIAEASARFGVPERWIRQVMRAESGGRTRLNGRPIESHAGAMGLMQLMPGTWRELRATYRLGQDPHDPRDNILAGTAYLREMYDRFGYPGLFAAYNAGPARYANHRATGRRLPAETVAYVAKVGAGAAPELAVAGPEQVQRRPVATALFVAVGNRRQNVESPRPSGAAPSVLFAVQNGSPERD